MPRDFKKMKQWEREQALELDEDEAYLMSQHVDKFQLILQLRKKYHQQLALLDELENSLLHQLWKEREQGSGSTGMRCPRVQP